MVESTRKAQYCCVATILSLQEGLANHEVFEEGNQTQI